jgi:hypothetical protein
MFDKRTGPIGIMFVAPYHPGTPFKNSVADGDSVELRIGEERILVHNLRITSDHSYRGKIQGFTPSYSVEFEGLKLGQEVEFAQDKIFACIAWA